MWSNMCIFQQNDKPDLEKLQDKVQTLISLYVSSRPNTIFL